MDTRDWSFAKRALAEIQPSKSSKHKKRGHSRQWVWVKVMLADSTFHWYQLPKDLQHAIKLELQSHNASWKDYLDGAIINVPISKYDENGNVDLTCGLIVDTKRLKKHTRKSDEVTRSQFISAKSIKDDGYHLTIEENLTFLQHDYGASNQLRITQDYIKLTDIGRNALSCGTRVFQTTAVAWLIALVLWMFAGNALTHDLTLGLVDCLLAEVMLVVPVFIILSSKVMPYLEVLGYWQMQCARLHLKSFLDLLP